VVKHYLAFSMPTKGTNIMLLSDHSG